MVRRQAGFTLIEVTLAIAIFGLALVFLTAAFVNGLMSMDTLRRDTDYSPYIRFVRAQAISIADLDTFEDGGDVRTPDDGEAEWEAVVEPAEVADLFRVQLRIELQLRDMRDPYEHEETIYLLRPTWSDPFDRSSRIADARDGLDDLRREERRR